MNKRPRSGASTETPIDMTAEEGSTRGDNTNEHIQDVNQGGRDTEMQDAPSDDEGEEEGEHRGPERSPKKKKKRKDKHKKKSKDQEKEKDPPSILKPGRCSPAAKAA